MIHCLVCTKLFEYKRVFDIPILWDDDCNFGRPICNDCLHLLIELVKENRRIKISWKDEPEPCRSKIRHKLRLDKKDPQRTIEAFF